MTDDTSKKKRGRSKVFRSCFRSSAAGHRPPLSEKSDDRDSKNERLGKPVLISVSGGHKGKDFISDVKLVNGDVADSGVDSHNKRSSSSRRRFSRILKAVMFETAMSKKIRRSSSRSSVASDTSLSSLSSEKTGKSINDSNQYGRECTDFDDSSSRPSYPLSSSSITTSSAQSTTSSSSINSNSRSLPDQKTSSRLVTPEYRNPVTSKWLSSTKQNPIGSSLAYAKSNHVNSITRSQLERKRPSPIESPDLSNSVSSNSSTLTKPNPGKIKSGGNKFNLRLCLFLLLSLFVLVIWGRIFAILCTSIWFYLAPRRRIKRVDSVTNATESLDTHSEQYKKRVIMAGLLDRSRNPVR